MAAPQSACVPTTCRMQSPARRSRSRWMICCMAILGVRLPCSPPVAAAASDRAQAGGGAWALHGPVSRPNRTFAVRCRVAGGLARSC
jgi:hypothetical protein